MKKKLLILSAVLISGLAISASYFWYTYFMVKTIKYDNQLTIYWGGMSGNSVVLVSEDGSKALVVDTKAESDATALRKNITSNEIIVVNTHSHYDHTKGNELYPNATIIGGAYSKEQWNTDSKNSVYPTDTISAHSERIITIGNETVYIYNTGRGHTMNDIVVYFKNRKLLVTGDLVFQDIHPVLFTSSRSNTTDWINILDMLPKKYSLKTVVSGHGEVADVHLINNLKEYFTKITQAINNPDELAQLNDEYTHYFAIPEMTSFENTVSFIKAEQGIE